MPDYDAYYRRRVLQEIGALLLVESVLLGVWGDCPQVWKQLIQTRRAIQGWQEDLVWHGYDRMEVPCGS